MDRQDLERSINELKKHRELFETGQTELDKMLFARFQSLQNAGFSETQALEIIKIRGLQ